jgi:proteasome accessory factor C
VMTKVSQRLNRILLMVPFIVAADGASVDELCLEFGITREELVCDLNTLQMCGVPEYTPADLMDYWIEGDRVFMMLADYFKRPLNLTREEAVSLFLVKAGVFEKDGPLGTALDKVGRLLSEREKADIEELTERIDVEMNSYSGRWKDILEEGLQKQQVLVIEYLSFSRDEMTEREVEPLSLVWSRGHWYLLAWCHRASDTRLFRLDRVKSVKLTGKPVAWEARESFNVPELVGEYKPGRKAHQVRLRFAGKEGRRLIEEWPTATFADEGGSVVVELRTLNLEWLSNYLLRFGDRVEIHAPKELKKMVRAKANELLKEYR